MGDIDFLFQALNLQQHSCKVCGGGEIVTILQNTVMVTQKIECEQQSLKLDCRDKLGFLPMLLRVFPSELLTSSPTISPSPHIDSFQTLDPDFN